MKKSLLEALDMLQELDFMNGPGMQDRPDTSGVRLRGAQRNFQALADKGSEWPYEDDDEMSYGVPKGPRGMDRGTRPGTDVHGGPPTPSSTYATTWNNESADFDEKDRHGRPRDIWHDSPDGEHYTQMTDEAMGSPTQIGPVAPMDGPQHDVLHFSSGTEEGDMLPDKDNRGPATQWGGPGTIPGTSGGWASSPSFGEHDMWDVPEEENEMKLREFFDPSPVEAEAVDNPAQDHFEDSSDEEIEDKLGGPGDEEEPDDDGLETLDDAEPMEEPPEGEEPHEFQLSLGGPGPGAMLPKGPPPMSGLMKPPMMGAGGEVVQKSSAWDVLQKVVDALGPPPGMKGPGNPMI